MCEIHRMDADVRKTLEKRLHSFANEIDWGKVMCEELERDNFELTHAFKAAPKTWLLRAKPPRQLQEGFGLAPEILLIAIKGEIQSRDLQRAADEVVCSGLRLDSNLVVATDDFDAFLQERLDRIPGRDQRVAWVWDDNGYWPPLSEVLRQRLPTYDAFEERDPVRGNQLMGRDAEVASLRTRVVRGDAVGVFGLRKMGKTSLVRAVTDWLDPASALVLETVTQKATSQACVVWIDAETLDMDATVDDVADEMLSALRRRMRAANATYKNPAQPGMPGLKSTCEALLDEGIRLCFAIDEYDFLFEREGSRGPVPGLSRLFRLLRAWAQQWQGAVSLVLIGRDPEHLSVPQLDGVSNPLLAWFSPMWLGPLTSPRDTEMLRRLGRRVGLEIGHESAALARKWTGGHPMLHRQFGSALREEVTLATSAPIWKVQTDPYCNRVVQRFLERDAVLTVDREILALLKNRYSEAHDLLLSLAEGENTVAALNRFGGAHGAGARVLRSFGIFDEATRSVPEHLSWYVQTLLSAKKRVAV